MDYLPSVYYRYATRHGDKGNDVAVLQLNLPGLAVDGVFADLTEAAVLEWQRAHGLIDDGIAGLATQQSIIQTKARRPEKEKRLPSRLLKSIAANESGFALAAAGPHLGDEGWDVGAFCRSSGSLFPDQPFLRSAYHVGESSKWTAHHVRQTYDNLPSPVASRYLTELAQGDAERFRWQLAILAHNWPAAALNIAKNGSATPDDDAAASWIEAATSNRLHTPREWVLSYVERATVYVQW